MEVESTTFKKTASEKKILDIKTVTPSKSQLPVTGNRIMDMDILSNVLASHNCPTSNTSTLKLFESYKDKNSWASFLNTTCSCGFEKQFYTSIEHR